MSSSSSLPAPAVRISLIAGRYLVFDPEGVAALRRDSNTCGTLVGTMPQQPTQNIFLGLPIELRPEEAQALVQRGRAHVVDDAAAHQVAMHNHSRKAYIETLRKTKQTAHKVVTERNAQRSAEHADKIAQGQRKAKNVESVPLDNVSLDGASPKTPSDAQLFAVTPTTTKELLNAKTDVVCGSPNVPEAPLARHLQYNGYYMTPGLRFGARYSVYPGDPLRFHAHYMANQYAWEEEIPILDVVEGGRLATAVKKAFLIGGEEACQPGPSSDEGNVRTYSIEWAGM
ncbi:uncharacterized protein F5Z01DRAFT_252109 [Emericellopsis atlantica]|uniref:tRNA-splicing endonuclease subunit Sen34 n=1 Tax=Emericellopsis atlantica TaxID=2614577 RepID=A0A9P7ZGY0_9HYPO|nr:uncharacterized protein F5Z01DRAFT_252109 [Emericellopsis atlantica]KAG9251815.1 hypothetical protein F5Z01DRAFT_252109 [Emericellopsis atlantica]